MRRERSARLLPNAIRPAPRRADATGRSLEVGAAQRVLPHVDTPAAASRSTIRGSAGRHEESGRRLAAASSLPQRGSLHSGVEGSSEPHRRPGNDDEP